MYTFDPACKPPTVVIKSIQDLEQLKHVLYAYCSLASVKRNQVWINVSGIFEANGQKYLFNDSQATFIEQVGILTVFGNDNSAHYVTQLEPFDVKLSCKNRI